MQSKPIIIAHRGASGYRPEHTLASYQLGIDQGADFIEPDLVMTKDGALICRHENEIGGTTDVADRPEFAARRATKVIDGESFEGWFSEDFTLAEIKTLRCKERLPQLRPANRAYDGRFDIPTLDEVIALAQSQSARLGRTIGIYPETKHPSYHESLGLSFDRPLIAALHGAGWADRAAPVFIQSFEVTNLKRLSNLTEVSLVQLMAAEGGPPDLPDTSYASMATPDGLVAINRYAQGIGPQKTMILPATPIGDLAPMSEPTSLMMAVAKRLGMAVHPWTFRRENYFLPDRLRAGDRAAPNFMAQSGDLEAEIIAFLNAGVTGVFSDHPDVAFGARQNWMASR